MHKEGTVVFQFPSNGKAYLNDICGSILTEISTFQFPSNGKAYLNLDLNLVRLAIVAWFQFPSNGKAYLNETGLDISDVLGSVSIPFKRESVSELETGFGTIRHTRVSIPFKRESVSEHNQDT